MKFSGEADFENKKGLYYGDNADAVNYRVGLNQNQALKAAAIWLF